MTSGRFLKLLKNFTVFHTKSSLILPEPDLLSNSGPWDVFSWGEKKWNDEHGEQKLTDNIFE